MFNTTTSAESIAEKFAPEMAAQVRMSPGRTERLHAFVCGHLPSGIDVEVVLTPTVKTAAVLPAEADALVRSDATELERQQAAQLVESVDAEFLILVTTDPAPIDRIPVNDQLTADHAHQFGLAFHELLHILKTAIGPIAELLESEIEPNHRQQVHDLINIIEDGAIEQEAIEGANFSDNAEIRLELTRRIHSQVPDDISDGEQVLFSFWDAVTSALYEWAIYPTGITEVLLDEDDQHILFASEADASGFDAVQEALQTLVRDALAIRGTESDDVTHSHDKTASVRRAQLVVETWQTAILPLLEVRSEASTQSPYQDESGDSDVDSNPSSDSGSPGAADSNSDPEQPIDEGAGGVHDEHPQLERSATDDPFQDVLSQPSITPDSFDKNLEATPSPQTSESLDAGTSAPNSDEASGSTDSDQDQPSQTPKSSDSRARALARSIDQPRTHLDLPQSGETPLEEKRDDDSIDARQSTIGDFDAVEAANTDHEAGETTNSHEDLEQGHDRREPLITNPIPDDQLDSIADPGPAHAEVLDRDSDDEADTYEGALEADRAAAHDEADREGIDTDTLERELEELAHRLSRDGSDDQTAGGNAGGPGQLDELEIVPIADNLAPPGVWADIEDGAAQVAGTLEKQLRLDRQRGVRRGLTAGRYDTTAGHRLLIGDPRVCKVDTPGREKRYALVLVLDRSGSMRNGEPLKIEVAMKAMARFAVAAEGLGIDVAIVDFIDSHARLVKPFSVETRHIQATLLDTDCGGGTPLADALQLASQLVENIRDEPLIVAVTDGEPSSVDDVIERIRASPAPICSLTIATDTQAGNLSADASELATYYEREATIYNGDQLDDRLDQFASLLVGF
ncbi:VWA domain-containing protein [Haloarcula onubensis]|uniref:VWA domain-containing protein n=1 Tax=Haloarcula onubensis TaxID=2950539 RepID=A0ABU2FUI6_9EURY|nr:VWA domain-containing protein [Halomicroarcula sp. S3CR25-11]MDS0283927.1 VWA domain-containing protein [Halomicroarcula sp. S3CR25-11]